MSLTRTIATSLFALTVFAAPLTAQETEQTAEQTDAAPVPATAETILASVNGEEITLGDLIALRAQLPAQYQSIPDAVLYSGLLAQIVDQTMLRQAAEKAGMDQLKSIQRGLKFQRMSYLAEFYTRERLNEQINEETLAAEYKKRYIDAEERTVINASHILVETEEEAKEIAELARAEGADFANLAKERSTGPSGPNGGDLGWFERGQMVPPFDVAVFSMEPGQISDPVETQFGWHVIRLNQDYPPLEQVREELIGEMTGELTQNVIEALRAESEIVVEQDQPGLDQLRNDDLIADE
ncbi:MAG: peptidylprolyl isomerase [Pseudomonadota bacterium]